MSYEFGKLYGYNGISGSTIGMDTSSSPPIIIPDEKITRTKILEKGNISENKTYPFSRKRNDKCNKYKWFPIGWAINIHSLGEFDDPRVSSVEWKKGNLNYLIDSGCWWFNFIYTLNFSNTEAWGDIYKRSPDQWTTTKTHLRLLDFLEKKKKETDNKIDIKALIPILSKTDKGMKLFLNGNWDEIPNGIMKEFVNRIRAISSKPQLLGWMLSDEPYGGDSARKLGVRQTNYETLLNYKRILEITDININRHPIFNVIRGYGNYDFDPNIYPQLKVLLNELRGIGDYIWDNFYLGDFLNDGNNGNGKFLARTVDRTKKAIENLIENKCNVNDLKLKKGWLLFSQGREFKGCNSPTSNTGYLLEEELRYQNYAAWINGAQGCCFWELSKSDNFAFSNVKKISYEAFKCSKFLIEEITDDLKDIKCYSTNNDIQFIVRKDSQERILLMVCNNSKNNSDCYFAFPDNLKVNRLDPICFDYNWEYKYYNSDKYFKLNLNGLTARAFYVR